MPPRIEVVGSANVDFVVRADRLPRPGETLTGATLDIFAGGKGANQAVAAARLGADVSMVGCVGTDWLADLVLQSLERAGVEDRLDRASGVSTGMAMIIVGADGENQIVVVPGANAELAEDHVALGESDAVMCQLEIPVDTVSEAARQARGFFCLNAAPPTAVPAHILDRADLIVVNRHELEALGQVPPGLVALTLGSEGAILLENGEEVARAEPPDVRVVDGTAAGDAFCACLVVSLLRGHDRAQALRRACAAGALAASRLGAQASLPTGDDVDAILRVL